MVTRAAVRPWDRRASRDGRARSTPANPTTITTTRRKRKNRTLWTGEALESCRDSFGRAREIKKPIRRARIPTSVIPLRITSRSTLARLRAERQPDAHLLRASADNVRQDAKNPIKPPSARARSANRTHHLGHEIVALERVCNNLIHRSHGRDGLVSVHGPHRATKGIRGGRRIGVRAHDEMHRRIRVCGERNEKMRARFLLGWVLVDVRGNANDFAPLALAMVLPFESGRADRPGFSLAK